ncbi:MAG: hypothetical protein WAT39_16525 [Planctomycetota bacterium]
MPVPRLLTVALLAAAFAVAARPQDPVPPAPVPAATLDATTAQALERLATLLADKRAQRDATAARQDGAAVAAADAELQALGWQFAGLAARLDVQDFEAPQPRQFDLKDEIEQLLRPALRSLKDATAGPRQVTDLQARLEFLQARQRTAEAALRAAERTRDLLPAGSAARAETERELTQRWRGTVQALRDEILVLDANLVRLRENQQSLFEGLTAALQGFVQNSGLSLLLALAVFLGVFFGLRFVIERLLRRSDRRRGFSLRLFEVVLRVLSIVVALAAMLVVPYARNDWFLLAVGIVFLLGAGWVAMRMAPQFVEQIRLVLNVGGVREGERIVVDGLPFRVAALRFYTRLENPELEGGTLRVPLQFLVGKRSRQQAPDEPWFPTRTGEVVLLADGAFGRVRTQTPEVVVVEHFGAERSYATTEFLKLSPRNLSRGFSVDATFAVARDRLADVATSVRERLERHVQTALAALLPTGLRALRVEFAAVQNQGLELLATADCDGTAAPLYFTLRRAMQQAFVDACRTHGWALPAPVLAPPAT